MRSYHPLSSAPLLQEVLVRIGNPHERPTTSRLRPATHSCQSVITAWTSLLLLLQGDIALGTIQPAALDSRALFRPDRPHLAFIILFKDSSGPYEYISITDKRVDFIHTNQIVPVQALCGHTSVGLRNKSPYEEDFFMTSAHLAYILHSTC